MSQLVYLKGNQEEILHKTKILQFMQILMFVMLVILALKFSQMSMFYEVETGGCDQHLLMHFFLNENLNRSQVYSWLPWVELGQSNQAHLLSQRQQFYPAWCW